MGLMLETPSASAARPRVTADELLAMPNAKDFELVNGVLVERHIGWLSAFFATNLTGWLGAFCRQQLRLDQRFQCRLSVLRGSLPGRPRTGS